MKKLKVTVTSGYGASKHAIALVHGISALPQVEVVLLLQVRVFSFARLKQLIRMHGVSNAWGKFRNAFLGSRNSRFVEETAFIENYLKEQHIEARTTRAACRHLTINFKQVKSLNDSASREAVAHHNTDLVVYAGGGILKSDFINSVRYGVLNAHSGPLPFFRGMNCLEWTLLHDVKPEVTVHLIDTGIDTGPILKRFPWKVDPFASILALRGKSVVVEVKALLEVLSDFQNYYANRREQSPESGLQFFTMHEFLKEKINQRLQKGWLPKWSLEEFVQQRPKK